MLCGWLASGKRRLRRGSSNLLPSTPNLATFWQVSGTDFLTRDHHTHRTQANRRLEHANQRPVRNLSSVRGNSYPRISSLAGISYPCGGMKLIRPHNTVWRRCGTIWQLPRIPVPTAPTALVVSIGHL